MTYERAAPVNTAGAVHVILDRPKDEAANLKWQTGFRIVFAISALSFGACFVLYNVLWDGSPAPTYFDDIGIVAMFATLGSGLFGFWILPNIIAEDSKRWDQGQQFLMARQANQAPEQQPHGSTDAEGTI